MFEPTIELTRDLWSFLKERRKFWLLPLILALLMITGFIIVLESSAIAPFIYSIF